MAFVEAQQVQALVPDADKVVTVGAGADETYGPFATRGYNQLVGAIKSTLAGTVEVLGNVLPGTGDWEVLYTKLLVPLTKQEFVVDCTYPYMRMVYSDPGAGSDIQVDLHLVPVSALESNRAADAPDIVLLKLGSTGGRGAGLANAAAAIAIPQNLDRREAWIRNIGNRILYIGYDNGITSANAYPVYPEQEHPIRNTTAAVYVVCAAGETTGYRWLEDRL